MTASSSRRSVIWSLLENRAAVLGRRDVVPIEVELQQDLLGVLSMFGSAGRWRGGFVELHWCGDNLVLDAVIVDVGDRQAVRLDLRIIQSFLRRRQRGPHPGFVLKGLAPVLEVLSCYRLTDERARFGGVGDQIARWHEAFVGREFRQADA